MIRPVVIVADPPWLFDDPLPGNGRGALKHYPCMGVDGITRVMLPTCERYELAVLFCWRVASMQVEAFDLIERLAFTQKSELVWHKLTRTGLTFFGMGRYVRQGHEVCLIATKGPASLCWPKSRSMRSIFEALVGEHSQKPDEFYRIVETLYPHSRKIEFFARTVRPGWAQHGNELGKLGAR